MRLDVIQAALEVPAVKRLRDRLHEASYPVPGGAVLYHSGGDIARLVEDLYAVCNESHTTGSSNLENDILRQCLTDLRGGRDLSDVQYGKVQALERKYSAQLKALRSSPDHKGQNYRDIVPEGTGRIVK